MLIKAIKVAPATASRIHGGSTRIGEQGEKQRRRGCGGRE